MTEMTAELALARIVVDESIPPHIEHPRNSPQMKNHPFAELFPMLSDIELKPLIADIQKNGLIEPITTYGDKILDGRNRYRACELAGVVPALTPFVGDDAKALDLVVSKNLHRRHLNASQRAMVAASLANMGHGGNRKSDQGADLLLDIPTISRVEAAKLLNVGSGTVRNARKVHEQATDELKAAVIGGAVSVDAAAAVAELPKNEQTELVKAGPKAVQAKATERRQVKKGKRPPQAEDDDDDSLNGILGDREVWDEDPSPLDEKSPKVSQRADAEEPQIDARFMPNVADAARILDGMRNLKKRAESLTSDLRKLFGDAPHAVADRIDLPDMLNKLESVSETLGEQLPE